MIHRFIGTSARLVQQMASQPVTWSSVTKAARGILTTAQHTLTVFGLSAVAMIALLYSRPDFAKRVSDFLSPHQSAPAPVVANNASIQLVAARAAGLRGGGTVNAGDKPRDIDHLRLAVHRDLLSACEAVHVDAVACPLEQQLDAFVRQPLGPGAGVDAGARSRA